MDTLARKSLPEHVRHAHAWAERQLNRASQFIRSASVSSTPSLCEIRNQYSICCEINLFLRTS
ncbi:hypothetical protein Tcan_08973 [Toxocara canis]|uniref:Uncharacterized protein n=1 Tax=Toxocara canis TaxID=6265 RepID=A0A0B2VKU5_TOXCA|nr:hypothetical protein Tcan_08973 [Toxocara canis]